MLLPRFAAALVLAAVASPLVAATPSGAGQPPRVESSAGEGQREFRQSSAQDRESLTLTVYQNGQTLVHDRREVGLVSGLNRLALLDVSPQLRAETLQLHGEHPLAIRAQRMERGLLTRQALLDAHVGRVVELRRQRPDGEEHVVEGVLRSAADGHAVVELEHGVEVVDSASPWRLVFPALPPGLRAEPGLVLELETESPGRQSLEMLYLTGGLGWQADYVVTLEDEALRLMGWATLDNSTGTAFEQARVRLVAGAPAGRGDMYLARQAMTMEADMPSEQAEGDYRLYTLEGEVDLGDAQRSQLPLFLETRLPMEREYRMQTAVRGQAAPGERRQPVTVHLRFDNAAEDGNRALPAGTARVYQRDASGESLFLGEDRLPATTAGGEVELTVGTAFDVTATREQTAYRRLGERAEEQAWSIRLRNTLDRDVRVRVEEQIIGDWTLLDASHDPRSEQGRLLVWSMDVPAGEETELRYRVEVRR